MKYCPNRKLNRVFEWGTVLPLLLAVTLLTSFPAMAAGTFRVNAASVATTPDGLSWATAFKNIQPALSAAEHAGGGEVWVAAGTYTNPGPNSMVVYMIQKVHIYGGFLGTEVVRSQRDWATNVTTIDGENKSVGVTGNNDSTIDGFVITRGYTGGSGGGMYNSGSAPLVVNCVFKDNKSYSYGAGIDNNSASPTLINCAFLNNQAVNGRGGAIENYISSPIISGCIFSGNTALTKGGAIYNTTGSPTITNCLFTGNNAPEGSAVYNSSSVTLMMNCTVAGNNAQTGGSAIYNNAPGLTLTNCIVWGDSIAEFVGTAPNVTYSCIQGGFTGTGNISTDPLFVSAPTNARLQTGSPCIDTGTASGAPETDILGLSRPAGSGYDMGTYEYGALPPPNAPEVTGNASPTNDATPTWTWTSGGGGGAGQYRYGYSEGTWLATDVAVTTFTPSAALGDGLYTLYVQERDAANHWSASGIYSIIINTSITTVTVPDVVGLDVADAETAITGAGLTFTVVQENSDTIPLGQVIGQSPVAGTEVENGSDVTLTVSSGPVDSGCGCAGCQTAKGNMTHEKLKEWFGNIFLDLWSLR